MGEGWGTLKLNAELILSGSVTRKHSVTTEYSHMLVLKVHNGLVKIQEGIQGLHQLGFEWIL